VSVSTRFTVEVDADQFDRLARTTQPLAAVAELVWNSLDAEAKVVTVSIGRTDLDAVDTVIVTDDGHGMSNEESIRDFHKLGGSWKKVGTGGSPGQRAAG
jgi:DNA topoisomerase VI subunit B